ncbi:hypothetical protein B0H14DRAFT_3875359 [Mycena olivaceomarginata]|nr:hypothetical protein B0H14DRAFT_3875359 [Mycena olivaceomarginata]
MLDGTGRWTGRPSTVDGRSVGRMPALPEGYWMSNAMIYGPASGSEGREAGRRELMGSGGIIGIDADGAHISCGWRHHMRIMAREAVPAAALPTSGNVAAEQPSVHPSSESQPRDVTGRLSVCPYAQPSWTGPVTIPTPDAVPVEQQVSSSRVTLDYPPPRDACFLGFRPRPAAEIASASRVALVEEIMQLRIPGTKSSWRTRS